MALTDLPVRGETWELSFGPEWAYGTTPTTSYISGIFGVVQSATLPDPDMEWTPVWALGGDSNRNFYKNYKNKVSLAGGIPDIWLLNGAPLSFPIGRVSTEGTDSETGGSTLDGPTATGDTSFDVADATGYETGEVIQVDVDGTTTTAECRTITDVSTNTITVNYPLTYAHLTAAACNEVVAPFTHTIHEKSVLDSLAVQHELKDANGNSELIRRWLGGKVGRASYSGSEGDHFKMSIDEMMFRQVQVDGDGGVATTTATYPTTEPYLFSYGALTLWGTEFARVKSFTLDVNNSLEPKYYITDDATARYPYEIREGRRDYRLSTTIDITDSTMFDELVKFGVNQGIATDDLFKGFDVSLVITRGANDTITFTLPPSSAAAGGDAQGCFIKTAPHHITQDSILSIPLDIVVRSVKIVVVDSVACWFADIA